MYPRTLSLRWLAANVFFPPNFPPSEREASRGEPKRFSGQTRTRKSHQAMATLSPAGGKRYLLNVEGPMAQPPRCLSFVLALLNIPQPLLRLAGPSLVGTHVSILFQFRLRLNKNTRYVTVNRRVRFRNPRLRVAEAAALQCYAIILRPTNTPWQKTTKTTGSTEAPGERNRAREHKLKRCLVSFLSAV